jgi:2-polyprenyl-3-methyl-5-hydroxy-6-metoxy-1,4-benzoquinol methylase
VRRSRRLKARRPPQVDPHWYETFFEGDWLELAVGHDEHLTRVEVDFFVRQLGLNPGARILDLACGHGRHATELASRGFQVTGADISRPALEIARRRASEIGVAVEWLALDMRDLHVTSEFDAVCNFASAFGYYPREEDDRQVLERVARSLVPGGGFLIETMNAQWLVRNFSPRDERTLETGTHVLEERSYDPATSRSSATWTLTRTDGSHSEMRHSMRVYTCPELCGMLGDVGLQVDGIWGGVDGKAHSVDRRRLVVRARKPATNSG